MPKWEIGEPSQEVCPKHVQFTRALPTGSPYAARGVIVGKDARALAAEILAMDDVACRSAFRGSAMKRAELVGLQRNARVVVGNGARRS